MIESSCADKSPDTVWISDASRDRILETVRDQLSGDATDPFGIDSDVVRQVLEQTVRVLQEIGALGSPEQADLLADAEFSATIGVARASRTVHPSHSLRAAAVLFDAALPEVAGCWSSAGVEDAHGRAARMLHCATVGRIADGAVGYINTLVAKLHKSHVEERQRVSRELHDRIGHLIAVAMQQVDLLVHDAEVPTSRAVPMRAALEEAMSESRRLSGELRREVDVDGLEKAIKRLVEEAVPERCRTDVRVSGPVGDLSGALAEEVYLTVREAVRNAVTHASAESLWVALDSDGRWLRAEVTDAGRGFDPTSPARADRSGVHGNGMQSMRERVDLLGGDLEVLSEPGRGTTVRLAIPLPRLSA